MPKIAVVGAGIIGMSQACVLQEHFPSTEVTVIAEKFSPNLTSDVAAGFWHPYLLGDIPAEKLEVWLRETFEYILRFTRSSPNHGAIEISGYEFNAEPKERPQFANIMRNFRELTPEEVLKVRGTDAKPVKQGWFYTTLLLEPTTHMKYLTQKFKANGGRIQQRKIKSLADLGSSFDAVVNCTGLGARQLVGDKKIFPIRGQVIRVRCPAVKHFYLDEETYCLPNTEAAVIGGTSDQNDWDLSVRPETAKWILEENIKKIPALKSAEVLSHHVGLRPSRPSVRLETEFVESGGKKFPVVHNYGHGGSGVTLFYGCALEGAELVGKALGKSKL